MRLVRLLAAHYTFYILFVSSVFLNIIQLASYVLALVPIQGVGGRRQALRRSQYLANSWWQLFNFITHAWNVRYHIYIGNGAGKKDGKIGEIAENDAHDANTKTAQNDSDLQDQSIANTSDLEKMFGGKETAILCGNHERGVDFTTGILVSSLANGVGCGKMMVMLKESLKYLPIIGTTHSLQGSLFLKRNWEKDQRHIQSKLDEMRNGTFEKPFWIGIYPEGTRITPKKRDASQKFAAARGLPILNNVLLPRTKGFVFLLQNLGDTLEAIYDVTCGYSGGGMYIGDVLTTGSFRTTDVHLHIRKFFIHELPDLNDNSALEHWLFELFVEKDHLLAYFNEHSCFPDARVSDSFLASREKQYRLFFAYWSSLITALSFFMSPAFGFCNLALQYLVFVKSFHFFKPIVCPSLVVFFCHDSMIFFHPFEIMLKFFNDITLHIYD